MPCPFIINGIIDPNKEIPANAEISQLQRLIFKQTRHRILAKK